MTPLPPKDPAERKLVRFVFAGDLAADETIADALVEIEVLSGADAQAGAMPDSEPMVDQATREVLQWVGGGQAGVDYGFRCLATGSKGGVHLASARLPVRRM